jgi:hypothetical protein
MRSIKRSYVMGYWPLQSNPKNSPEHYSKYLPQTLAMIRGQSLVFYSSDQLAIRTVSHLCQTFGISLFHRSMLLEELPKFNDCAKIVLQTEKYGQNLPERPERFPPDKGLKHYWQHYSVTDPLTYQKMLATWNSKIDVTNSVAELNPFETEEFAWIDASLSRFKKERQNWNFARVAGVPGVIRHYPSRMRKQGKQLNLNASFLLGDSIAFDKLKKAFDKDFQTALLEVYPNDEETILSAVIDTNPNICQKIGAKNGIVRQTWADLRRHCQSKVA